MLLGEPMPDQYLLAIDGGTQSTKVSLFDTLGNEISKESVQLQEISLYGDNRAEHPGDDLWDSLQRACRKLLERTRINKESIIGVGLGSIRCCRALIKDNGDLASPIQSWMDMRLSRPYLHEDDKVRYVTTSTGYLTYRLTGQTRDTRANYVGPWPIDPISLDWLTDDKKFKSYLTPRDMLFELVNPSSVLGKITPAASRATHIPEGVPVVATANDKAVEALGAGLIGDGDILVSLGTYITSMMVGKNNRPDTKSYWSNPGAVPGDFLYESCGIRRGMATVSWLKDLLGSDIHEMALKNNMSPEAYLNRLGEDVPPGCNGLYTLLNWLPRPSHQHERGMMIGFDGSHKAPHMFRSILEGIALTMKNHVKAMCDERSVNMGELIISGGGAKGDLFMQIFADVFDRKAHRNTITGSASLGAAMCTALGLGIYKNKEEATRMMVSRKNTFHPKKDNTRLYDEINESVYKQISPQTDELLRRSHTIFSK